MAENLTHDTQHAEPAHPEHDAGENPALVDAEKTFKIIAISAVLFVLAMSFIILRTRLG